MHADDKGIHAALRHVILRCVVDRRTVLRCDRIPDPGLGALGGQSSVVPVSRTAFRNKGRRALYAAFASAGPDPSDSMPQASIC